MTISNKIVCTVYLKLFDLRLFIRAPLTDTMDNTRYVNELESLAKEFSLLGILNTNQKINNYCYYFLMQIAKYLSFYDGSC